MQDHFQSAAQTDATEDKRSAPRRRLFKHATISPDGRETVFDCVLRNLSETGARLRVVSQYDIPDVFQLTSKEPSVHANAKVIWREGDEIGVGFLG